MNQNIKAAKWKSAIQSVDKGQGNSVKGSVSIVLFEDNIKSNCSMVLSCSIKGLVGAGGSGEGRLGSGIH